MCVCVCVHLQSVLCCMWACMRLCVCLQASYIPKKIRYQFTLAIFSIRNSATHLRASVCVMACVCERKRERERPKIHRHLIIKQNSSFLTEEGGNHRRTLQRWGRDVFLETCLGHCWNSKCEISEKCVYERRRSISEKKRRRGNQLVLSCCRFSRREHTAAFCLLSLSFSVKLYVISSEL